MKINTIKRIKGSLFEVLFDNDISVMLNSAIISDYGLKEDTELTKDKLSEIVHASDFKRAKERALYLLDIRDYSYKEMFNKLEQNYPENICFEVMGKLTEWGFINDRRYAENLIRKLCVVKKYGTYRIRMELRQKGISNDLAETLIEEYDDDTEERISSLIEKKYAKYLTDKKGVQKVTSALARLGYAYNDIHSAISEYMDNIYE